MKVGDRLANLLIEYGIEYVFGVPGGQTLQFYHGIMKSSGKIEHILMRDERSAGYAADAYARISGRTGICDATVGPGATNLVSPLAEAYASSIPMIAIISDIPRAWEYRRTRGNASQALRQLELFDTISKWQANVVDAQALDDMVDTAFRIANSGRPGPVVLCIPDDVFSSQVVPNEGSTRLRSSEFPIYRTAPDPVDLQKAVDLIRRSRMPALLVGGGALISGAFEEVRQLSETLGAPVATTISGKGIMAEDHPNTLGVAGSMGRPVANEILDEADLVIFIGTKTGQLATFGWEIPGSEVLTIHIDIDPEEMGKNFCNSIPLVGDARLALASLLEAIGNDPPKSKWQKETISKRVREWYRESIGKHDKASEPLKPQIVMDTVNKAVTEDSIAICDASLASGWAALYYQITEQGRKYLAPRGLAGLGWGAPAAIGASLATGRRERILLFAGDGGFAYSIQELEVMARLKLPIVSIVFNNDALAWIKHIQQQRFKTGYISTDFHHIDFATVAKGFGVRGYTARTAAELSEALRNEQSNEGPAVIDVITDQWETPVLRSSSIG